MDAIEKFLARLKLANQSRSKEIRLTIEDAGALAADIATLLTRHARALEDVAQKIPTTLDGDAGSFRR